MKKRLRGGAVRSGRSAPPVPAAVALLGDSPLESLVGETVALFHRLRAVSEQIHQLGELSSGKHGVLKGLGLFGPQTVPQMARARPVSRQYIQTLVNLLAVNGHVELVDNPGHKRSRLVRLTPGGKKLVEEMNRRQAEVLEQLPINISETELRKAASILRALRQVFEAHPWKKLRRREE